jgi:hypothetical protein
MSTPNTQPDHHPINANGSPRFTGVWKAAGLLLLCAVSVGVTLAYVRLTGITHGESGRDTPVDPSRSVFLVQ